MGPIDKVDSINIQGSLVVYYLTTRLQFSKGSKLEAGFFVGLEFLATWMYNSLFST